MKKSQAEHFQDAKHQKEITGNVWNANYDGNSNETSLNLSPHCALESLNSYADRSPPVLRCSWQWGLPYLEAVWFQGRGSGMRSPKVAPKSSCPISPFAWVLIGVVSFLRQNPLVFLPFPLESLADHPLQLCAVQMAWVVSICSPCSPFKNVFSLFHL